MIITFYSYKGGVGRSMAVANIAKWLQLQGLRVVMIDWDLEAPGLESFFASDGAEREALRAKLGLIDMLVAYRDIFASLPWPEPLATARRVEQAQVFSAGRPTSGLHPEPADLEAARLSRLETIVELLSEALPPLSHVLVPIKSGDAAPSQGTLWLLSAGCRSDARFNTYAASVQKFDWDEFYGQYEGEAYFEWLRRQLVSPDVADVVLIDSRTGVAEMNGACTRQMADVIVIFCAPNDQNLEGVARMASSFTRPDVIAARGQRPIDLIMVPARVDVSEGRPVDLFESSFHAKFDALAPQFFKALKVGYTKLRIPYISAYAYAEHLAIGDPQGVKTLQEAYVTLAAHIAALAPADSPLKRVCLGAIQQTFGLPTVLVVRLTPDVEHLTASIRGLLDRAGVMTILATDQEFVLDPTLQRTGPGGGPVPVVVPITSATVADTQFRELCRRARQQGLCVTLVTEDGNTVSPDPLPRWAKRLRVFDATTEFDQLLATLLTPCRMLRAPFLAPPVPPVFVGRGEAVEQVRTLLLEDTPSERGGAVALVGLDGIGKTALATVVCHDANVIDCFDDGILWATLGIEPNLLDVYSRLIASFSDEPRSLATVDEARRVLSEILTTKRCLLVLDDVWQSSQLVFPTQKSESRVLVTTSTRDIAAELGAIVFTMVPLRTEDAVAVLAAALPTVDAHALAELASTLDGLPLALQLAIRSIRTLTEIGEAPPAAVATFTAELAAEGLVALDPESSPGPGRSVLASYRLAAERLNATDRARLPSLADTPPNTPVFITELAQMLRTSESEAELFLRRLASASLVTFNPTTRTTAVPMLAVEFFKTLRVQQKHEETTFGPQVSASAQPWIFLSYRRGDATAYALRISDRLARQFGYGSVFLDVVNIAPGEHVEEQIQRMVSGSGVVVALIDRDWERRLQPDDAVVLELGTALEREIPVIPVLIEGARMPDASALPPALRSLARLQALELNSQQFQSGVDFLIRSIERFGESQRGTAVAAAPPSQPAAATSGLPSSPTRSRASTEHRGRRWLVAAVLLSVLVVSAAWFVLRRPGARTVSMPEQGSAPQPVSPEAEKLFAEAEDIYLGRMGPRDYAKAAALYRRAAELGSSSAMNSLGRLYENGEGVPRSDQEALRWYGLAASLGHPDAIASLNRLKNVRPREPPSPGQRRIQISAVATPKSVSPGEKASISVIVRDAGGAPLPDAAVSAASGGGRFLRFDEPYDPRSRLQGPRIATGKTDREGRFTTWWVCSPCAPDYSLSLEASKPDYLAARTELMIKVR